MIGRTRRSLAGGLFCGVFLVACSGVDPEVVAASRPEREVDAGDAMRRVHELLADPKADPVVATEEIAARLRAARDATAVGFDAPAAARYERRVLLRTLAGACFNLADVLETRAQAAALSGDALKKSDERRLDLYESAKNFAFEELLFAPDFRAAMDAKRGVDSKTAALLPEGFEEPALLTASAWARAAEIRGLGAKLADRSKFTALAKRALELNPGCHEAGPHRFFGVFYAKAPGIAGGDMDKSREHFEKAIARAPTFLANRVLFAEHWMLESGERDRARVELEAVVGATVARDDPNALEQRSLQERARMLLARIKP